MISLEDCTVADAKTLAPDSDDELSDSQRFTKRRRIEKLAESYLRGERLPISFARPCPQTLKRTIVWHKKSSTEPGFKLPDVDTSGESARLWREVENDDEVLARLLRPSRHILKEYEAEINAPEPVEAEPAEAERAEGVAIEASRKPQRRLRTANISSGPSEDALRQAAALRDRRTRRVATEMNVVAEGSASVATPASDPLNCINVTQSERLLRSRHEKSEWLSRRKSRFSFGGEDSHAVTAEADASSPCIAPSSPPLRSPDKVSYHTAPEDSHVFQEPVEAAAADPPNTKREMIDHPAPDTGIRAAPATTTQAKTEKAEPTYLRALSTQNGTTPLMYRKRTSRSKATDQEPEAMPAAAVRRSSRRRVTFPSSEDVPASGPQRADGQNVASQPPVLDISFGNDYSFAPKLNMALVEEHNNTLSPAESTLAKRALRRDSRNGGVNITRYDSEPPQSLLVEDLPQPLSPQNSAPVQSLATGPNGLNTSKIADADRRQTWLGTQAMVARAERELFISPEKHRSTFTPINEQTPASRLDQPVERTPLSQEREPLKQLSQEPAPSTQAMLDAFGGFSTVKKPRVVSMLKHAAEPTPVAMEKGKGPDTRMPSDRGRGSLTASSTSNKPKETRARSLRFSVSSFESPLGAQRPPDQSQEHPGAGLAETSTAVSLATPAPSSSNRRPQRSSLKSSNRKSSQEQHAQLPSSNRHTERMFSEPMTISEDFRSLHCFPAAQESEPPVLRDQSNLSQTIDDLTKDVLGTTRDLDGVLSQ